MQMAPPCPVRPSAIFPMNVELLMVAAEPFVLMAPPVPKAGPVETPSTWLPVKLLLVTVTEGP